MYKWPNRCAQLRYRASAIPTTGTLAPVQDYSAFRGIEISGVLPHPTQESMATPGNQGVDFPVKRYGCRTF
jgi:hypothetical protein